jgi:hypothetical protein
MLATDQGKVAEATAQPKKESANNGEVPSATVPPTSNRSSAPGTNGADPNKKTIVPTAVLNPGRKWTAISRSKESKEYARARRVKTKSPILG